MKKVYWLFFLHLLSASYGFAIDKPLLKSGFLSSMDIKFLDDNKSIYPQIIKDTVFLSFKEKLNDYFTFYHKIEFEYKRYNKFSKNIDDLRNIYLKNNLKFDFTINKFNKIIFYTTPVYQSNSENIFKMSNKLEYRLSLKNFCFQTYYSNSFILKENQTMNHKINFNFYFSFPKKEFIKFKTTLSTTLQNYIYEQKNILPLKSVNLNFEVAFDFNNKSFEDIFSINEDLGFEE